MGKLLEKYKKQIEEFNNLKNSNLNDPQNAVLLYQYKEGFRKILEQLADKNTKGQDVINEVGKTIKDVAINEEYFNELDNKISQHQNGPKEIKENNKTITAKDQIHKAIGDKTGKSFFSTPFNEKNQAYNDYLKEKNIDVNVKVNPFTKEKMSGGSVRASAVFDDIEKTLSAFENNMDDKDIEEVTKNEFELGKDDLLEIDNAKYLYEDLVKSSKEKIVNDDEAIKAIDYFNNVNKEIPNDALNQISSTITDLHHLYHDKSQGSKNKEVLDIMGDLVDKDVEKFEEKDYQKMDGIKLKITDESKKGIKAIVEEFHKANLIPNINEFTKHGLGQDVSALGPFYFLQKYNKDMKNCLEKGDINGFKEAQKKHESINNAIQKAYEIMSKEDMGSLGKNGMYSVSNAFVTAKTGNIPVEFMKNPTYLSKLNNIFTIYVYAEKNGIDKIDKLLDDPINEIRDNLVDNRLKLDQVLKLPAFRATYDGSVIGAEDNRPDFDKQLGFLSHNVDSMFELDGYAAVYRVDNLADATLAAIGFTQEGENLDYNNTANNLIGEKNALKQKPYSEAINQAFHYFNDPTTWQNMFIVDEKTPNFFTTVRNGERYNTETKKFEPYTFNLDKYINDKSMDIDYSNVMAKFDRHLKAQLSFLEHPNGPGKLQKEQARFNDMTINVQKGFSKVLAHKDVILGLTNANINALKNQLGDDLKLFNKVGLESAKNNPQLKDKVALYEEYLKNVKQVESINKMEAFVKDPIKYSKQVNADAIKNISSVKKPIETNTKQIATMRKQEAETSKNMTDIINGKLSIMANRMDDRFQTLADGIEGYKELNAKIDLILKEKEQYDKIKEDFNKIRDVLKQQKEENKDIVNDPEYKKKKTELEELKSKGIQQKDKIMGLYNNVGRINHNNGNEIKNALTGYSSDIRGYLDIVKDAYEKGEIPATYVESVLDKIKETDFPSLDLPIYKIDNFPKNINEFVKANNLQNEGLSKEELEGLYQSKKLAALMEKDTCMAESKMIAEGKMEKKVLPEDISKKFDDIYKLKGYDLENLGMDKLQQVSQWIHKAPVKQANNNNAQGGNAGKVEENQKEQVHIELNDKQENKNPIVKVDDEKGLNKKSEIDINKK